MTTRPTPRTPFEIKQRRAEEEQFYARHGGAGTRFDVATLATALADALQRASEAVRALATSSGRTHAH